VTAAWRWHGATRFFLGLPGGDLSFDDRHVCVEFFQTHFWVSTLQGSVEGVSPKPYHGAACRLALAERRLLLLLGHASNEINVLSKLILMAGQGRPTIQMVDYVGAGQALIVMRLLIGKLHEACELFKVRFKVAALWAGQLEPAGATIARTRRTSKKNSRRFDQTDLAQSAIIAC
jgi:hypothetical protein